MHFSDVLMGLNGLVGRYPLDYCKQLRYQAAHPDLLRRSIQTLKERFQTAAATVSRPTDGLKASFDKVLKSCDEHQAMVYDEAALDRVLRKMQLCLDEQMIRETLGHFSVLDDEELERQVSNCLELDHSQGIEQFYARVNQLIGPPLLEAIRGDVQGCCGQLLEVLPNCGLSDPNDALASILCPLSSLSDLPTRASLRACGGQFHDEFKRLNAELEYDLKTMCRDALSQALEPQPELQRRVEALNELSPDALRVLWDDVLACLPPEADTEHLRRVIEPVMAWHRIPRYAAIIQKLHTWKPSFLEQPMWYRSMRGIVDQVLDNEEKMWAARMPRWAWHTLPSHLPLQERLWYSWMRVRAYWMLLARAAGWALLAVGLPVGALVCQGLACWGDAFRVYYKMRADQRALRQHAHTQHWARHRSAWPDAKAPAWPPGLPSACYPGAVPSDPSASCYQVTVDPPPESPVLPSSVLHANLVFQAANGSQAWLQWGVRVAWEWGWIARSASLVSDLWWLGQVIAWAGTILYWARVMSLCYHTYQAHRKAQSNLHDGTWDAQREATLWTLQKALMVLNFAGAGLMLVWTLTSPLSSWAGLSMGCGFQVIGLLRERIKVVQAAQPKQQAAGDLLPFPQLLWQQPQYREESRGSTSPSVEA